MLLDKFNKFNKFNYLQLLRVGIHVGHSILGSSIYAAWMVYGFRGGICLINISKFMQMFRLGLVSVASAVGRRKPVWFVSMDRAIGRFLRFFAQKCGEFASTFYWVRGMLSNYQVVTSLADRFAVMSGLIKNRRRVLFDTNFDDWLYTRYRWPGLVFVSSIFQNYFVVNEALSAKVPCMGIWDTNGEPQGCTIAIPGNDDSVDAIVFYCELLAEFVLYRKFLGIFLWFLNTRRQKRLLSFYSWLGCRKGQAKKVNPLESFFSTELLQDPLAAFVVPYKLFLGQTSMCLAGHHELFRSSTFSLDTKAIVAKFEAAQRKYYYLLSYGFFLDAARGRARNLFRSRRRRRRLLFRRQLLTPGVLLRKAAARARVFLRPQPSRARWRRGFSRWRRPRSLAKFFFLRSRRLLFRKTFLRFLQGYFFFFFCYFKESPYGKAWRGWLSGLGEAAEETLEQLFASYRTYCAVRKFYGKVNVQEPESTAGKVRSKDRKKVLQAKSATALLQQKLSKKKETLHIRHKKAKEKTETCASPTTYWMFSPRGTISSARWFSGWTFKKALHAPTARSYNPALRGSFNGRYRSQQGVAQGAKAHHHKRFEWDKDGVSKSRLYSRGAAEKKTFTFRRGRHNESPSAQKRSSLWVNKSKVYVGKIHNHTQTKYLHGSAQRVYRSANQASTTASSGRRVSLNATRSRLREKALLRSVNLGNKDLVLAAHSNIVFTALYERWPRLRRRVSMDHWAPFYLHSSEELLRAAELPFVPAVRLHQLRRLVAKFFLKRTKRVFLRFLFYGFFRPLRVGQGLVTLATKRGQASMGQPQELRGVLAKSLKHFKHQYAVLQLTDGLLASMPYLQQAPTYVNYIKERLQFVVGLKRKVLFLYKKFCFLRTLQSPLYAAPFFQSSFNLTSKRRSSWRVNFWGIRRTFSVGRCPMPQDFFFPPELFTAYDFFLLDKNLTKPSRAFTYHIFRPRVERGRSWNKNKRDGYFFSRKLALKDQSAPKQKKFYEKAV